MDKVHKPMTSQYYTPSSKPFRREMVLERVHRRYNRGKLFGSGVLGDVHRREMVWEQGPRGCDRREMFGNWFIGDVTRGKWHEDRVIGICARTGDGCK
jgi:hypothetical protein